MGSVELSRRVRKVVAYPPLCEMDQRQRREFHEALLDADSYEDLPGKWQAAILEAEQPGRICASSVATESPLGPRQQLFRGLRAGPLAPRLRLARL